MNLRPILKTASLVGLLVPSVVFVQAEDTPTDDKERAAGALTLAREAEVP